MDENKKIEPIVKPLSASEVEEAINKRLSIIGSEFSKGFELIKKYPQSVSIFGSSELADGSEYYEKARRIAGRLAKLNYAVITGGGPGIMEAANRGAFEAGGKSVGLNIQLPRSQPLNKYLTDSTEFFYFFSRKVMLAFAAEAYIFFPGGFGTLDEFFELVELLKTQKIFPVPIILVGKEFWEPLDKFIQHELMEKHKTIKQDDLSLYRITDDEEKIVKWVLEEPVIHSLRFNAPL